MKVRTGMLRNKEREYRGEKGRKCMENNVRVYCIAKYEGIIIDRERRENGGEYKDRKERK